MNERFKIFAFVAVLGFFAGIIADLAATYVIPALVVWLPAFFSARYILSGFAGACLTMVLVAIWAYVTASQDR